MKTTIKTSSARAAGLLKPKRTSYKPAALMTVRPLTGPKRILVPIDFSKASCKALRYAIPYAEQFGATIYLVNVLERASFLNGVENIALAIPDATLTKEAKTKLLALADAEIEELVPVNVQLCVGRPFDEIVKLAKTMDIDLIIIATHGYTGLRHVLMGSTAEQVVRHSPCPVLVVREKEKEFVQT